jgi:hypothetical protein
MIFFIGIPFESSQSILNFEVTWSAVSILVSGVIDTTKVIDTAHHWSAVPLWDNVRLRPDLPPDFSECESGSSQKDPDLPPWSLTPLTTKN